MKFFTKCLLFLLIVSTLYAEENDKAVYPKIGIEVGYNYNLHNGSFKKLPGIPNCCPKFESGNGYSLAIGLSYQLPIFDMFSLKFASAYKNYSGTFDQTEGTAVFVDNVKVRGEFLHHLETDLPVISLETGFVWNISANTEISLGIGGAFLMNPTFSQYEKITNPAARATFIDSNGNDTHSFFRNQTSGDLPDYNKYLFYIPVALNYSLPLNRAGNLKIVPEVKANIGLNPVIPDYNWKINSFSLCVAIKYQFMPEVKPTYKFQRYEQIDTIKRFAVISESLGIKIGVEHSVIDTAFDNNTITVKTTFKRVDTLIAPKKVMLNAEIKAYGIDKSGNKVMDPEITIEEFSSSVLLPILNYIFFDKDSSTIPKRYAKLTEAETYVYNPSKLESADALKINHEILNIVGYRLKQNPETKITLVSCLDGTEEEKNIVGLASSRAESIKNYLSEIWKIDSKRIITQTRPLPEKFSQPISDAEKAEENRRVELVLPNELLKPIIISDTLNAISPTEIEFKSNVNSDNPVTKSKIIISDSKSVIQDTLLQANYQWNIEENSDLINNAPERIFYSLKIEDNEKNNFETKPGILNTRKISIRHKREEKIHDKEIDKFSLILFDFDKADLQGGNLEILNMISKKVKPNSQVSIVGYTDKTGDAEHNRILSEMRAKAVYNALGIKNATYKGLGEQIELFNNTLPEGRFYSRTVEITIETPLE